MRLSLKDEVRLHSLFLRATNSGNKRSVFSDRCFDAIDDRGIRRAFLESKI